METKWEIKKGSLESICLYENGTFINILTLSKKKWKETLVMNFTTIVYRIAKEMDVLATPEQMLDTKTFTYKVGYLTDKQQWVYGMTEDFLNNHIIKDMDSAMKITRLLNDSPAIKEWLEHCKG